jgi:tachylectin
MKRCRLRRPACSAPTASVLWAMAFACVALPSARAANEQVIYGINPDGDLLYYKYLGMSDGSKSWGKTGARIGNGWNFRQVFSGGDGVIFAITEEGDLLYHKYRGLSDTAFTNSGSSSWGTTGARIGNGWNFRQVFSGGDGVIFAINEEGELLYYRYLGMSDGSRSWGASGARIGNGWGFPQVFAELRSTLPGGAPRAEALPQENQRCQAYAQRAFDQFQLMNRLPKCQVTPTARWSPDYKLHYEWCLSAQEAELRSEEKARDDHLYRCGGQIRFD